MIAGGVALAVLAIAAWLWYQRRAALATQGALAAGAAGAASGTSGTSSASGAGRKADLPGDAAERAEIEGKL